jgi:hypothetical protein
MHSNSFQSFLQPELEVKHACRVAVTESLKVQEGERVLIITNPVQDVATIAFSVYDAVQEAGGIPVLLFQPVKTQLDFCAEEVSASIGTAPDVVVSLSADKLGKDRKAILEPYFVEGKSYDSTFHYLLYGLKKLRSFWSPGITRDCFIRTVPVDYKKMKTDCEALKTILDRATSIVVENPNGTQIRIGTAGRTSFTDDGDFSKPGTGGNLPAGETFLLLRWVLPKVPLCLTEALLPIGESYGYRLPFASTWKKAMLFLWKEEVRQRSWKPLWRKPPKAHGRLKQQEN